MILTSVVVGFHGFFVLLGLAYGYGVNKYQESRQQPIAFSHYKHVKKAGLQCTNCHTKTATTTRAGIPPMEKCMECHESIKTDSPEIQKLHAYYGKSLFDIEGEAYISKLDEGKLDSVKEVFAENLHMLPATAALSVENTGSKWRITDTGQENKTYEVVENEGLLEVRGVKNSIPWNRMYWLPDHVYFSHKRHIKNTISRYPLFRTNSTDQSGLDYSEYLNELSLSPDLKDAFNKNGFGLSEESKVEVKSENEWWITDPAKDQPYSLTKHDGELKVSKVGLDCTECHGLVQYMDIPRKIPSLRMGWCVQCHKSKGASLDCVTCHK